MYFLMPGRIGVRTERLCWFKVFKEYTKYQEEKVEKGGGGQEEKGEKDASDIMYNNIGVMRNLEPFCGGLQQEEEEEEEETGVITYALRSGRSCKCQVCCTSQLIIEVFRSPPLPASPRVLSSGGRWLSVWWCLMQKIHLCMYVTGYLSRSSLLLGFWIGDRQIE
jgi:hypothetical protein